MFSGAFREFETDPFFDFGNSPFRRGGGGLFRDDPADSYNRRHAQLADRPANEDATDLLNGNSRAALVPAMQPQPEDRGGGRRAHRQQREVVTRDSDWPLSPPGFPPMLGSFAAMDRHFSQVFDGMHRMMADMGDQMRRMEEAAGRDDFDGHMYSHTAVYSNQLDGRGGEPHVYQAVSETRAAPGGLRETRKAIRDSRAKEERAAHGRHIGGRSHVVERRRNVGTGEQREDHNYAGIGEDEADAFDKEWHSRATVLADGRGNDSGGRRRALRDDRAAAPTHSQRQHRQQQQQRLAIEAKASDGGVGVGSSGSSRHKL